MRKIGKKVLSFLMVSIILLSSIELNAFAVENEDVEESAIEQQMQDEDMDNDEDSGKTGNQEPISNEDTEQETGIEIEITNGTDNAEETDDRSAEEMLQEEIGFEASEPLGTGGTPDVTRIQWLIALTDTFDMTVDEDNYPDNYFTDIDNSDPNYRDVMVATEFGLVDVEAGDPLCPNEAATREFAAHTLNLCLGYQLEENAPYTFSEKDTVTYPDDIQISIDKGWFALSSGAFLPEQGITMAEKNNMISTAKSAIQERKIEADGKLHRFIQGVP